MMTTEIATHFTHSTPTTASVSPTLNNARKLSASTDADGPQEIRQSTPEGVEVKKNVYGHGVFATSFFPKGSVVYVGRQLVIPNEYAEFQLVIENTGQIFLLNTDTHSVQFSESSRWLYLFDSFMNHSCDPTTISHQTPEQKVNNQYSTIALRDIHPGDEITCDYNLFEYDCEGKVIETCLCGSPACIGRIAGFKYISSEEQKRRIQLVDQEVLLEMANDADNKFIYISDLRCPTSQCEIVELGEDDGHKLIASKSFKEGEIVFRNESLLFPSDRHIVIEVIGGKRIWLDNLVHTVNKGDGIREFYFFDSFQNHSCDPNTHMIYVSDNVYDLIASRDIEAGGELTSDYESFDEGFDGTSFHCQCGSIKCRTIVKA
jgi:hypothetical protein